MLRRATALKILRFYYFSSSVGFISRQDPWTPNERTRESRPLEKKALKTEKHQRMDKHEHVQQRHPLAVQQTVTASF